MLSPHSGRFGVPSSLCKKKKKKKKIDQSDRSLSTIRDNGNPPAHVLNLTYHGAGRVRCVLTLSSEGSMGLVVVSVIFDVCLVDTSLNM
jgi:hypothetical protein